MADKRVKRQASGIGWTVDGQPEKVFRTRAEARRWDRAKQKAIKAGLARAVVATLEPVPQEKTIVHQVTLATGEVVELGYTIRRLRQDDPFSGNGVIASAIITLPAGPGTNTLHPELRFGSRIARGGYCYFSSGWGYPAGPGKVETVLGSGFQAETWREAFSLAEKDAKWVISVLIQAVEARREALKAAEE